MNEFRQNVAKMFEEAEAIIPYEGEVEVVGVVMAVEVVQEVKKVSPWHWNSLTCSSCSRRCDDVAFQGIALHLSSCGHFYCQHCSGAFQPNNENYKSCVQCNRLIYRLTRMNF